jgi:cytidylate kinase
LAVAKDAIIIDTTNKTIMQVVEEILDWIKRGGDIVL